ncbi:aminomethyl-transferring glycine dehydrogenase subunit GcvPB [bacterium]|nr:aminomethyl-transferring glycine dehydrogenase subunit GcvPB [bacterium]
MNEKRGASGLILNEPLLWEKGSTGRCGISIPKNDVKTSPLDKNMTREGPGFPDLSEVDVIRHYTRLSQWNFGVDTGMYPLGSCTMKYNPKTNERQASLKGFNESHPFLPDALSQGALELIYSLENFLKEITGMDAVSLQPAAGAHGELTGMLLIHAYHRARENQRSKIIIPDTAHGTNPASAALCGYQPVNIQSGEKGILTAKSVAAIMDGDTAGIMVTNPNTLGLYEEELPEIAEHIHEKGGLVYCDGANMNALMGILKVRDLGVDIIHLNLHKTFSTPHGGGGPGAGPVACTKNIEPYLPIPRIVKKDNGFRLDEHHPESIGRIMTFYGHFGVMVKAYSYILSLGAEGLKKASRYAVLNANYIKEKLKDTYHLPYDRPCMHECVFSDENHRSYHVSTLDIAKRLIDYGFHPPTIYFPLVVSGAIMIEPTETESKEELDQFVEAMKAISDEAREHPEYLKNAPHLSKVKRLDETAAARKPCLCG